MFHKVELTADQIAQLHDIVADRILTRKNQLVTAVEGIERCDDEQLQERARDLAQRAAEIRDLGSLFAVTNINVKRDLAELNGVELPEVFEGRV